MSSRLAVPDDGSEAPARSSEPSDPTDPSGPSGRELLGWFGVGLLLTVVLTWPLVLHLGERIPQDLGDPLGQAWALAWGGHALLTAPGDLFEANTFWPAGPSLAFSDSLLGYAPFGLLGEGVTAAVVRYDLVFLFAYALAFAGGAFLARELGCSRPAAFVAGAAFAFAPWRASHNGHLNVLSSGGIPLALALLAGGYRRARPGRVLAGWAVAAWQLTIGFALGIYFFYLLALLGGVAVVRRLRRGGPPLPRRVLAVTLGGLGVSASVVMAMVTPYFTVLERHPEAARDRRTVEFYSPPPSGLLAAPAENRVWGGVTGGVRRSLPWAPEQALFPGLTIVGLAVAGVGSGRVPRGVRAGLAAGAAASVLLSFGLRGGTGSVYGLLYELLPGVNGLRAPGRLNVVTSLAVGVLGGFGADRLTARLRTTRPSSRNWPARGLPSCVRATAVMALLGALVVAEGAFGLPLPEVPAPPPRVTAEPQFHLPAGAFDDTRYMLWSVEGFPRLANGYSGVIPNVVEQLELDLASFPDAASVHALRALGFRAVVLHSDLARGTPWASVADRPVAGLPLTRSETGPLVVFVLDQG